MTCDVIQSLYEAVSVYRRRWIVRFMAEREGEMFTAKELSEALAAHLESEETGEEVAPGDADRDYRRTIYAGLTTSNLPQLDKRDVIEFDKKMKTAAPGPRFDMTVSAVTAFNNAVLEAGEA